jgi:C_GCAxxG_C_C family probable redox protein
MVCHFDLQSGVAGTVNERNLPSEKAVKLFEEGYNCAQSVLMAMCEHWRIRSNMVPKVATAFGSGIGRCGSVCGALVGGVMAIGVKFGTDEPSADKRQRSYALARTLYERFEDVHGSVLCRELIGYRLSVPQELEKAKKAKVFDKKCKGYMRTVVGTLLDIADASS